MNINRGILVILTIGLIDSIWNRAGQLEFDLWAGLALTAIVVYASLYYQWQGRNE